MRPRRHPLSYAAYAQTIELIYPKHLRERYRDQMLQTARDADRDRTSSALYFWAYLYADLVRSSLQERTHMFRDRLFARPILVYTTSLALILTIGGLSCALTIQAAIRRSADQPQIQMAKHYASAVASGKSIEQTLPPVQIDMQHSLEPFAIFYDLQAHPVASTGHTDRGVPAPPPGVFDHLTANNPIARFTWQPESGIRVAAVMFRINGSHPGYILVGRSLAATDIDMMSLRRGAFVTWFILMALLCAGALFLDLAQRMRSTPITT